MYVLIAIVGFLQFYTSANSPVSFLNSFNIATILQTGSQTAIIAVAMTVVLVSGNFDLSVASVAVFSGTIAVKLIDNHGTLVAVLAAFAAGGVVGWINGFFVQKVGVNAFIITLGTLTLFRGLVNVILKGQTVTPKSTALSRLYQSHWAMPTALAIGVGFALLAFVAVLAVRSGSRGALLGSTQIVWATGGVLIAVGLARPALLNQLNEVWIMIALGLMVSVIMRYTVIGRNIYAVGGNPEAARLSGINVDRYRMGAFMFSGLVSGGTGLLIAGQFNSANPTSFQGYELIVIAGCVLGGTSLFGGAGVVFKGIAGVMIMYPILTSGFAALNIDSNWADVVRGAVLILAASSYVASTASFKNSAVGRRITARRARSSV